MKGISPLIAAVLLIAFTVAIATIIMGWMGTFTRSTTETISNRTDLAIDCASASINIEDVYVTAAEDGVARVIVKNTGFSDNLIIQTVQLVKNNGQTFNATAAGTAVDSDFDKGEIITATVSTTGGWLTCTNISKVVATTTCGGVEDVYSGLIKGC